MNRPKIPPKCMTNSVTTGISGYLSCIKLGIFLRTSQGPKSKANMSVRKKIQIKQLIVMVITIYKMIEPLHSEK